MNLADSDGHARLNMDSRDEIPSMLMGTILDLVTNFRRCRRQVRRPRRVAAESPVAEDPLAPTWHPGLLTRRRT